MTAVLNDLFEPHSGKATVYVFVSQLLVAFVLLVQSVILCPYVLQSISKYPDVMEPEGFHHYHKTLSWPKTCSPKVRSV